MSLAPGPTSMQSRQASRKREKHPEFEAVRPHMAATLTDPDYIGRHPVDGTFSAVKRVADLPNGNAAVLVAIGTRRNQAGDYAIKSAYGVTEETLKRWAAAGNLRPVK